MRTPAQGLYAILDTSLVAGRRLAEAALAAQAGGAAMLQLRDKSTDPVVRRRNAERVVAVLRGCGTPVLINDDADLAGRTGADGVHLGQEDTSVAQARAELGRDAIIGVTCHADLDHAYRATADGADYLSFGRFYASETKPQAPPAAARVLAKAKRLGPPVVAIGGVNADNGHTLIAAGADLLAAAGAVFAGTPILPRATALAKLFA